MSVGLGGYAACYSTGMRRRQAWQVGAEATVSPQLPTCCGSFLILFEGEDGVLTLPRLGGVQRDVCDVAIPALGQVPVLHTGLQDGTLSAHCWALTLRAHPRDRLP